MRRFPLILVMAALACNGKDDDAVAPVDTDLGETGQPDEPEPPPEPPTWQVTGEFGSLVAVHRLESVQEGDESYDVQAVFARNLQKFATAAGCLVPDGVCVKDLPTDPDTFVDTEVAFETNRNYTWNGFEIGVDTVNVPFVNDIQGELQYYDFSIDTAPLDVNPVVTFSGLWGAYTGPGLVIPPLLLIEPSSSDNIDVTDGFGTIRWTPGGPGDPYVRIVTDDFTRVYKLEDDGLYELDYEALGLDRSERPELTVGRWSIADVDVNGNTLTLVGMTEQPCGTQICDEFPQVVINGSSSGAGLGTSPNYLGVGYQALIYDGQLEDYRFSGDDLSAALVFTVYDASERPLCNVTYDASNYSIVQYPTDNGLALWQAWSIDLGNGGGASTCGRVDPAVFGTEDMRDYIESFSWGFGIGEMSPELTTQLSLTFGPDWPLIQPLLHAVYVTNDGITATEMGFGRNADLNGCYTGSPTLEPDELVPSGPDLPDSLYIGAPYYVYDIQP